MKRGILAIILTVIIIFSIPHDAKAASLINNVNKNNITVKPIKQERIKLDNENVITLETYDDNGITIYALTGETKNKDKANQYVRDYLLKSGKAEATNTGWNSGYDSRNSNCESFTYVSANWYDESMSTVVLETSGYQQGILHGTTPAYADFMICNQSYNINGLFMTVTVSYPPTASFSSDKSSGTWQQSIPISHTYNVSASHPNLRTTSHIALTSCTYTDSVDMYIGANIYRPSSSVTLNTLNP